MEQGAIFFLGYFIGVSSKCGEWGPSREEWKELTQMACDQSAFGDIRWLKEAKKLETQMEEPTRGTL